MVIACEGADVVVALAFGTIQFTPFSVFVEGDKEGGIERFVHDGTAENQLVLELCGYRHEVAVIADDVPLHGGFVKFEHEVDAKGIQMAIVADKLVDVLRHEVLLAVAFFAIASGLFCMWAYVSKAYDVAGLFLDDTTTAEIAYEELALVDCHGVGNRLLGITSQDVVDSFGIEHVLPSLAFILRAGDAGALTGCKDVFVEVQELAVAEVKSFSLVPGASLVG